MTYSLERRGGYPQGLIQRTIDNLRKSPFKDPRAQAISEKWIRKAYGVPDSALTQIGMLWMTKILAVNQDTAKAFVAGDLKADYEIGMLHAGSRTRKPDIKGFWEGVSQVAPQLAQGKDLAYLVKNDHQGEGAWLMICHLAYIKPDSTHLTTKLEINAICYK
jgi:hypothetical protein